MLEEGLPGLHAADSYRGHQNPIFAMSYDDKRNQLISGAKDGTLIVWTADGKVCSYPHFLSWLLHHLSMFLLTFLHDLFE
jgi:WD40 repeat protein